MFFRIKCLKVTETYKDDKTNIVRMSNSLVSNADFVCVCVFVFLLHTTGLFRCGGFRCGFRLGLEVG